MVCGWLPEADNPQPETLRALAVTASEPCDGLSEVSAMSPDTRFLSDTFFAMLASQETPPDLTCAPRARWKAFSAARVPRAGARLRNDGNGPDASKAGVIFAQPAGSERHQLLV